MIADQTAIQNAQIIKSTSFQKAFNKGQISTKSLYYVIIFQSVAKIIKYD